VFAGSSSLRRGIPAAVPRLSYLFFPMSERFGGAGRNRTADKGHTAQAAFVVLAFTGLRSEGLKGLRWDDYDRENDVLNIKRTIVHGKLLG
jgi:integrase